MKFRSAALWCLVFLCLLAAPAFAQSEEHADPKVLLDLYRAVVGGQFGWLAGLALILAIEPVKRLLLMRVPFLATDLGGVLLAFVMAAIGGCAHALTVGATWDLDLGVSIARNAVVAIGGYAAIKRTLVARWPWLGKVIGASLPRKAAAEPAPAPALAEVA